MQKQAKIYWICIHSGTNRQLKTEIGWFVYAEYLPHTSWLCSMRRYRHITAMAAPPFISVHVSVWADTSHLCVQLGYFKLLLVGCGFQGQAVHVSVRSLEFFYSAARHAYLVNLILWGAGSRDSCLLALSAQCHISTRWSHRGFSGSWGSSALRSANRPFFISPLHRILFYIIPDIDRLAEEEDV